MSISEIKKSKKYRLNYEKIKFLVWDSFCSLDSFFQNSIDLYGVNLMIKKIYACQSDEEIKKLVFSII